MLLWPLSKIMAPNVEVAQHKRAIRTSLAFMQGFPSVAPALKRSMNSATVDPFNSRIHFLSNDTTSLRGELHVVSRLPATLKPEVWSKKGG